MINSVKDAIQSAQSVLDAFAARFAQNPAKALQTAPYAAAAMLQEMTALLHLAAIESDPAHLRAAYARSAQERLALTPPSMHNHVDIAQGCALQLIDAR